MTPLNTIIEEEKKEFEKLGRILLDEKELEGFGLIQTFTGGANQEQIDFLTSAMQRAYEAGRADWLRSEIEKLKGMKRKPLVLVTNEYKPHQSSTNGYNQALDSIITRYKEELKELEK